MRVVSLLRRVRSLRWRRLVTVLRELVIGVRGLLLMYLMLRVHLLLRMRVRLRLLILVLLLLLLRRSRGRHVHALFLSLIALCDGPVRKTALNFVVLLDKSTA
jgi:hypothetical protein